MKTFNEVKETKESNLKDCFVLWKTKAKSGLDYLTGHEVTPAGKGVKLVAYYNTTKKNPEEPDIRVYVSKEGKTDIEVASLWDNLDKNEKRYLTGKTNEGERLVGWYNEGENEKRPYIRCYYK